MATATRFQVAIAPNGIQPRSAGLEVERSQTAIAPNGIQPRSAILAVRRFQTFLTIVQNANAPTVTNYTPTPGSTIGPFTALGCDVTDDLNQFRRIILIANFPDAGVKEVVHDGDSFTGIYSTSTRTPITNGYRYAVKRTGGWPFLTTGTTTIAFEVVAIDTSGNEA